ncbi:C40 family peptidase [Tessaracoccus caeni]|uniref:C40 family peptidase n=1 Tax=Tessaracoccus caeni TaxID=3031239 RepID=UPI0023DBC8EC|nr:C40 family peptidase [Tessaracoccus caeni]MDF1486839.1 NlpC/P60 family protein [Tessaracoccus caeni]
MSRIRTVIASLTAGVMVATLSVSAAQADPDKVREAKAKLDEISQQVSAIDQEIIEASARVDEAEAKLKVLTKDLLEQEELVSELSTQLGEVAIVQLQTGGFDLTAQLFSSSDESDFLSSLATIHSETERSNAGLQELQVGQAKLTSLRNEAEATEEQLVKDRDAKVALADDYRDKEAEAKEVYDRLNAEEQERLARLEEERLARLEEERLAAASREGDRSNDGTESAADSTPAARSGSTSDRAAEAVEIALAQVGKSYVWGTAGPSTFDCSGLMAYAYGEVGVSLTRSSRAQSTTGTAVSKSELRPGDLVFYYSPVSHVGMYIGDGKIVHAANPRRGIVTAELDSMPYSGARRVA